MARAYLRLDPAWFEHKIVEKQYPHGAATAWMAALCLCETQPERGRFRTEKLLRLLLDEPKHGANTNLGKWVPFLVEHGDLIRQPDGSLYMDGWDEWQEGDLTVKDRMQRLRSRKRDGGDPASVTVPTVNTPSSVSGSGRPLAVSASNARVTSRIQPEDGLPHITEAVQDAAENRVGIGILSAGDKPLTELDRLCEFHGEAAVLTALEEVPPKDRRLSWTQLIYGARNVLEPIPGSALYRERQAKDESAKARIRTERSFTETERRLAALKAVPDPDPAVVEKAMADMRAGLGGRHAG